MAEPRHLSNPPITEALIDIQVEPVASLNTALIEEAYTTFRDRFPEKRILRRRSLKFDMGVEQGPGAETTDGGIVGYHFVAKNGEKLVQFKLDGFTFNKLPPYDTWEAVCEEAKQLWSIYKDVLKPNYIKRIAVRYVNKIEIPVGSEISDYFTAPPLVPDGLPKAIEKFISRITIGNPELNASAIITLAFEGVYKADKVPILLDIDVYKLLKINANEDSDIWSDFKKFRDFKNEIFFNSLKEKALESYL